MEEKYTSNQLAHRGIGEENKVYAKQYSLFINKKGTMNPSYQLSLPQHSKLNKATLKYIHDSQDKFKVENTLQIYTPK